MVSQGRGMGRLVRSPDKPGRIAPTRALIGASEDDQAPRHLAGRHGPEGLVDLVRPRSGG